MIKVPILYTDVNDIKNLNRYLIKLIGIELSNINNPCYYPKFVKYARDLERYTGCTEDKIKQFYKDFPLGYISQLKSISDKMTSLLVISILYYLRINQLQTAKLLYYVLSLRFHANHVHKFFPKFCKDEIWNLSLQKISQKHLFKAKNGIGNSIVHLTEEEYAKRVRILKDENLNDQELLAAIYALKHRLQQSMRSFSNRYYELESELVKGAGISTATGDEEISNIELISQKVSESISTYSIIDKKSLENAIIKSRVRRDLAAEIIYNISNNKYKDDITFIVLLIPKIKPIEDVCVEHKRTIMVRNIVQDKRKINNKYSISDLILNLIYKTDVTPSVKTINKSQLVLLIVDYLTSYMKKYVC